MRLLEGTVGEPDRARIRTHLRSCARCLDSYRDSAVVRGLWVGDESGFAPTDELFAAAANLAAAPVPRQSEQELGFGRAPASRAWRYGRLGLAAAGAVAVLAVGLLWFSRGGNGPGADPLIDAAVLSPVRSAVETASARGLFVLPGGEGALDTASPVYRSGFVPVSDSLSRSLELLQESFRGGDSSIDLAAWLIGAYIATGQYDAARDLADHPRLSGPGDWRVSVLRAIVAYMDGQHGESEALLRGVAASDPENPVALINLAIVLSEGGSQAEARSILARVSEAHAGTPLATRAKTVLSRIEDE